MLKTDLSTFNNDWYSPGAGIVKRVCWYNVNAVFFNSAFPINSIKVFLLRLFGAQVGKNIVIKPYVNIKYPWKLRIDDNVWIGEHAWIDNLADITIKDNVCISQGAYLLCGNHNYKKSGFDLIIKNIVLEEGVWIGAKAIVCPGVICSSHSILTAGSTISKNMEAYWIYSGNPAVKIRERRMHT